MTDDTILPFSFPAVAHKKITAAFDGGRLMSDGGVMLLSLADRRLGIAAKLAGAFPEWRDRSRTVHTIAPGLFMSAGAAQIVAKRSSAGGNRIGSMVSAVDPQQRNVGGRAMSAADPIACHPQPMLSIGGGDRIPPSPRRRLADVHA